jgi:co-chaperonin GroES (HSP10)|tara:strand:+ start:1248 stop:1727 length:480 start_codon:yes stop_codon:yes gene_type:complete
MSEPTLLVPDYYTDPTPEESLKEETDSLESAYVQKEDLFLEPSKLSAHTIDRLPHPTGWRILLLPYQGRKATDGGIVMPDSVRQMEALTTVCGYVLLVGPDAYKDKEKFPNGPWCAEKEWVIFGRYAGSRFRIEGGEVRLLNDDEVLARISDPSDILHV